MTNRLLEAMASPEKWSALIKKAEVKGLSRPLIQSLISSDERLKILDMISNDDYSIFPPKVAQIPKGNGEFRSVYVNSDRDRIVLTLINDCLCDLFKDMIHPCCRSYQKGLSTQKTVREVSEKICSVDFDGIRQIGYKSDFSKYFDSVKIEAIDHVFDQIEDRLGYDRGTEPVMNLLRRYYHQDYYFDQDDQLHEKYQSLKQGCAVASFLANVILYDLDVFMSNKYEIYYRYSDDCIVLDPNTDEFIDDMNRICSQYGVILNPKKVKPLYKDEWFDFLGFMIKGSQITLTKKRVKKFQEEIEKRSIKRKKCSEKQALRSIYRYLYEGDHCWASTCYATMNVKKDMEEMDHFILDAIRACGTGKKKIGGLGTVTDKDDYTIVRGKGRNVRANKQKSEKEVKGYLPISCLADSMKMSYKLFETVLRSI